MVEKVGGEGNIGETARNMNRQAWRANVSGEMATAPPALLRRRRRSSRSSGTPGCDRRATPVENIIFTSYASSRSRAIDPSSSLSLSSFDPRIGRTHSIPSSLAWRAHGLACAKWPFGGFESREIPSRRARSIVKYRLDRENSNRIFDVRGSEFGCPRSTEPGMSTAPDWPTQEIRRARLGVFLGGARVRWAFAPVKHTQHLKHHHF